MRMGDLLIYLAFAGFGFLCGSLSGYISWKEEIAKTPEEQRLYHTIARHEKHRNVVVLDAKRHLLICAECGVVYCADQAGTVGDWSKVQDGDKSIGTNRSRRIQR